MKYKIGDIVMLRDDIIEYMSGDLSKHIFYERKHAGPVYHFRSIERFDRQTNKYLIYGLGDWFDEEQIISTDAYIEGEGYDLIKLMSKIFLDSLLKQHDCLLAMSLNNSEHLKNQSGSWPWIREY